MNIIGIWLKDAIQNHTADLPITGSVRVDGDFIVNERGQRAEPVFIDEGSGIVGWILK